MLRVLLCPVFFLFSFGCNFSDSGYILKYSNMKDFNQLRWEQDSTLLVLAGNMSVLSGPVKLRSGKYVLEFSARGEKANNILPHFVISVGNYIIRDISIAEGDNDYSYKFELPESLEEPLQFTFDNDYNDSTGDRNIYLLFPVIIRRY